MGTAISMALHGQEASWVLKRQLEQRYWDKIHKRWAAILTIDGVRATPHLRADSRVTGVESNARGDIWVVSAIQTLCPNTLQNIAAAPIAVTSRVLVHTIIFPNKSWCFICNTCVRSGGQGRRWGMTIRRRGCDDNKRRRGCDGNKRRRGSSDNRRRRGDDKRWRWRAAKTNFVVVTISILWQAMKDWWWR